MWKVFLVDDEEIILNQIKQTVPWMDNGFEVIGMETNPDRAVSMVIELKPLQIQEVQLVLEKLAKKLARKKPFEETNEAKWKCMCIEKEDTFI